MPSLHYAETRDTPHLGSGVKVSLKIGGHRYDTKFGLFWQHMKQMEDEFQMDHAGTLLYGFTMCLDTF